MNILLRILFFLLFISCSYHSSDSYETSKKLGGYYNFEPPSQIEIYFGYLTGHIYAIGSNLFLKKDSSFIYRSCGNIKKGHWKVEKDSLLLFVESNRWRNDSLNQYGFYGKQPEMSTTNKPVKFEIKNNGALQGKFKAKMADEKFILIETLIKKQRQDR